MVRISLALSILLCFQGCVTGGYSAVGAAGSIDVSTGPGTAILTRDTKGKDFCYFLQPATANQITIDAGPAFITVYCVASSFDPTSGETDAGHVTFRLRFNAESGHTYAVSGEDTEWRQRRVGGSLAPQVTAVTLLDLTTNEVVARSDQEYTVPDSDKARVFCAICAPALTGEWFPAGTRRVPVSGHAGEARSAAIQHEFLGGHTYVIEPGVQPNLEFPEAPAVDQCVLLIDRTVDRHFISCTPMSVQLPNGVELLGNLASAAEVARVVCIGCTVDSGKKHVEVIVDAGPVNLFVSGGYGVAANVRFDAEAGSTYFLQKVHWNSRVPEFEEALLREAIVEPSAVIKKNRPEAVLRKSCFLTVRWAETREFVGCFTYGNAYVMEPYRYGGDWRLVARVHSQLRTSWSE